MSLRKAKNNWPLRNGNALVRGSAECCCEENTCTCCEDSEPNLAAFTIAGIADFGTPNCGECADANGTYAVPVAPNGLLLCDWIGSICEIRSNDPCNSETHYNDVRVQAQLKIFDCPDGSGFPPKIRIVSTILITVYSRGPVGDPCDGSFFYGEGSYTREVEVDPEDAPYDCKAAGSGTHTGGFVDGSCDWPTTLNVTWS